MRVKDRGDEGWGFSGWIRCTCRWVCERALKDADIGGRRKAIISRTRED